MERTEYTKTIPPFFQLLLDRLVGVKLYHSDNACAWEYIGYHPTKDGINIHTSKLIKLSHELAHILEIKDNERLLQLDYGIKKYLPTTPKGQLQAIAREARTKGIQTLLVEIAFNHFNMLYHRHAYLFNRDGGNIGKFSSNQEILDWSFGITKTAYENWSEDKILYIWNQKAEFINHWLETKHASRQDCETQIKRNADARITLNKLCLKI